MTSEQMANDEIRAVVFDYGGVLARTVNPVPRRDLERRFELEPGGAYKAVFENPLWNEVQFGRISSAEFWADVGQRLGLSTGELVEFRQAFWAGALIRYLRDEGYRTVLLSNAPASASQHLEQVGITDAFDVVVISGREGSLWTTFG